MASSSISKFSLGHGNDNVYGHIRPSASAKLKTQLQVAQEAQADLARKTGDLGLYCQSVPGQLRKEKLHVNRVIRVLLALRWAVQPRLPCRVHCVLLALHHPPAVLAQALDGIKHSEPNLLSLRIRVVLTDLMGFYKWDNVVGLALTLNHTFVNRAFTLRSTLIRIAPHSGQMLHKHLLTIVAK